MRVAINNNLKYTYNLYIYIQACVCVVFHLRDQSVFGEEWYGGLLLLLLLVVTILLVITRPGAGRYFAQKSGNTPQVVVL